VSSGRKKVDRIAIFRDLDLPVLVPYRQISSRLAAIVPAAHSQVFIPHITISRIRIETPLETVLALADGSVRSMASSVAWLKSPFSSSSFFYPTLNSGDRQDCSVNARRAWRDEERNRFGDPLRLYSVGQLHSVDA
jgi:hypothetical protein